MPTVVSLDHFGKTFRVRTEKNFLRGIFNPHWKDIDAVKDVSFSIEAGEAVAFLGPNGAGKTTTLKALTGLIHPSRGEVRVLDATPSDRKPEFLRRIGFVMGNKAGLNWDLTARQSYELFRRIYRIELETYTTRLAELSEMLDVADKIDTQVRRLSLGERMKVELIGAILHRPEVLFLDEPTIGLDIVSKHSLRLFLRELWKRDGTTLLLTSHDMDDVEQVCERVVVITEGSIVSDGPLRTLAQRFARVRHVRLTFAGDPPEDLKLPPEGKLLERDQNSVLVQLPMNALVPFVASATASIGLIDIHVEGVPLETIIAAIYKGDRGETAGRG